MKFLTLITSLLFFGINFAQTFPPCFTVDQPSGCAPHTINVTDCSGHPNPQYTYGTNPVNWTIGTSFTFTDAGSYEVIQAVDNGGIFTYDTVTVNVWPIPVPSVELSLCDNFEVWLDILSSGYDYYVVDWNDGSPLDTFLMATTTTHIFPNSNQRNIKIYGRMAPENCGNDTTITLSPIQTFTKTNIDTLRVIDNNSLKLNFNGQQYVTYQLNMYKNGALSSSKEIQALNTSFEDTIKNMNTTTDTYCFELTAIDKCSSTTVATSRSDKVCSVILNGTSQPGYNEISWNTYTGDNTPTYDLYRNQSLLQSFASSQNPYNDSSIFCSQEYIYQLLTITNSGSFTTYSYSNEPSVIGKSESSPNAVTNVFSTFNNDNQLVVNWKSVTKIPPQFYTVNTIQVTDTFMITGSIERTCYEITYTDSCGNTSQVSERTCPIILKVKQNSVFELELNWNNYEIFQNGLSYNNIYIYNDQHQLIDTIDIGTATNFIYDVTGEEIQIYYFRIEGISNNNISTFSNEVKMELNNLIMTPNAFSPNGDGLNDIFIPKVRFVKDFNFAVYNKWGQNLFTSNDQNNGWDGGNSPSGVYTFLIQVTDYLGEKIEKKGTVTLIR